ncbi:MAG: hypothetical protein SFW67_26225 [Myxococcaceae bacterium]|nr:hypothetical protein [Myxococcaceae bacterium]
MRLTRSTAVLIGLLVGCGTDFGNPVGTGSSAVQIIGPSGGTLRLEGVTLTVPAGALRTPTSLTVTSTPRAAPAPYESFSPVYAFGPEGTEFAVPARVEMTSELPGGSRLVVYWTRRGSTSEYVELSSVQAGGKVTADVTHFSSGFIGESRGGPSGTGGGLAIGPGGTGGGAGEGGGAGGGAAGGGTSGGGGADGGLTPDGGPDGGFDGGADGGFVGGSDGGFDGGADGGSDGGLTPDGGRDGGFDGGSDGGFDAGSDGGFDAGSDGGFDAGSDGGFDGGSDGGFDGGSDGGFDAGSDGGFDGGSDGGFGSPCASSFECAPGLSCFNNVCQ